MSRPGCAAGNCLLGSQSPWFLLTLGVVWAVVAVLFVWWGVTVWRERRKAGGTRAVPRRGTRRPRHAPKGRAAESAVSVQELTQRLNRERVATPRRPPRRVAVLPRVMPPAEAGPATAPLHPSRPADDDE